MSAAEAEKKATPLKSLHLNNLDISSSEVNGKLANGDAESSKSNDDSDQDSSNESAKSADEEEEEEEAAPFKPVSASSKKRKLASRLNGADETRTIEIKRWVQIPPNIAEKTPDKTFLAPRRAGMPPLYNPEYAQKIFGQFHSSSVISGATGYDLGEGGGLSNASGVLGAGADNAAGTATPPRKNIPPRRKKKKLGGPGRKKANPNPEPQLQPGVGDGTNPLNATTAIAGQGVGSAMEGVEATAGQISEDATLAAGAETSAQHEGDGEDNDSGSDLEGSEEGEIDEGGGAEHHANHEATPTKDEPQPSVLASAPAPEVTITDTDTVMKETAPDTEIVPLTPSMPEIISQAAEPIDPPAISIEPLEPEVPLQPPLETVTSASIIPSTEITIPGLGAIPNDAEQQAIVDENAQIISNTDVDIDADIPLPSAEVEPEAEAPPNALPVGASDVTTAVTATPSVIASTEVPEVIESTIEGDLKDVPTETNVELAAPVIEIGDDTGVETKEAIQTEAEAGTAAEMDLLGAMDAAIDRGMSEGA